MRLKNVYICPLKSRKDKPTCDPTHVDHVHADIEPLVAALQTLGVAHHLIPSDGVVS